MAIHTIRQRLWSCTIASKLMLLEASHLPCLVIIAQCLTWIGARLLIIYLQDGPV